MDLGLAPDGGSSVAPRPALRHNGWGAPTAGWGAPTAVRRSRSGAHGPRWVPVRGTRTGLGADAGWPGYLRPYQEIKVFSAAVHAGPSLAGNVQVSSQLPADAPG